MRVQCPKCDEQFQAKSNARRIRCPGCGFREDTPESGFASAWASGKPRKDAFKPMQEPAATSQASGMDPRVVWGAVAVVAILLVAGWWFLMRGGDNGTTPPGSAGDVCGSPLSSLSLQDANDPVVVIQTSSGCLGAEIYKSKAPITAANFMTYVDEGYYAGLHCYRIVASFVNQCGGDGDGKTATHAAIADEAATTGLHNTKYTLSMARTDDGNGPATAQTEFFINAADNIAGNPHNLDPGGVSSYGYSVFGKLLVGQPVSDQINTLAAPPGPSFSVTHAGAAGVAATSTPPACPTTGGPAQVGLITTAAWNVSAAEDYMYVYARNTGASPLAYSFEVTGSNGAALPAGWSVSFGKSAGCLAATKGTSGDATSDWASTLATVKIPATQPPGDVAAELHAAGAVAPFTFHVNALGTVSKVGDSITTCYDLYGGKDNRIQANKFPLTVGTGAVLGYEFGTAGLAAGETVKLSVPPPLAYGASGNPSAGVGPWEALTWYAKNVPSNYACPTFQA